MPATIQQLALGGAQFDGAALGVWEFEDFERLPRTTGIAIEFCAYTDGGGGGQNFAVTFYVRPPSGGPLTRVILGRGDTASMINPQNSQHEAKFCGVMLPRQDTGEWWEVICISTDKTTDGIATVQYRICPHPESLPGDSP